MRWRGKTFLWAFSLSAASQEPKSHRTVPLPPYKVTSLGSYQLDTRYPGMGPQSPEHPDFGLGNFVHQVLAILPGLSGISLPRREPALRALKFPSCMESWELLRKIVILARPPAAKGNAPSGSCG